MTSPTSPRPSGGEGSRLLLETLARVLGAEGLDVAMTEGAGLLARVISSEHAAVFLADGKQPLREYWHSEFPEARERIRATFKIAALEAARSGVAITPAPVALGDRLIQPRAFPLLTNGCLLGAVCFSEPGETAGSSEEREHLIPLIAGILAHKAALHEEIARYRAQVVLAAASVVGQ